jgi:hypothetical protein
MLDAANGIPARSKVVVHGGATAVEGQVATGAANRTRPVAAVATDTRERPIDATAEARHG